MVYLVRVVVGLTLITSAWAAHEACAQPPDGTGELPAAAAALRIDTSQVLSAQEAHAIRARGISVETSGVVLQMVGAGQWSGAAVALAGTAGGQSVTIAIDPSGLRFRTRGAAVLGDHSQFRGALVTRTGVFNGYVAFEGSTSTMSVVAVPGMFAVDFR